MMTPRGASLAALLFATALGCEGEAGRSRAGTTDLAVQHPDKGVWTQQTAWRAVEELRLGREAGAGPDVFGMPVALEVDAHGRLYVLDAQAGQVRVFAPDGGHVRSFGGQGAGPGEFSQPVGMALAGDGALWVVDPGNGRFSVFDTAGDLRATVPRPNGYSAYPWPGRFDRQGRLWDVAAGPAGIAGPPALVRMDPGTGVAERLSLPPFIPPQFTAERGPVRVSAPIPFSPALVWALDADGRVWSGVTDRYRFALHEAGGDTLRVVELAAAPVRVSDEERAAVPAELSWFTDQGGRVEPSRVPRHKPAFVSIRDDDLGWLWVRPSLPGGGQDSAFDVFDPEGRYHGRMPVPLPRNDNLPLVVRGDRIYAVGMSEAGVPQVVRLRIEGRGSRDRRQARFEPPVNLRPPE
ncbi:MAG TPA: 6-bladed beta-propeller [Longimicrobium sp.]|nr:6-bladed beta-propeller [Longimicrobium sp.]